MKIAEIIAKQLGLREKQVEATINLLTSGATIPFISRYRKEATGGLNEVQVAQVKEQNDKLEELVHRRDYIITTIEEQGKLTDELKKRIETCCTCPSSPNARLVPRWHAKRDLSHWPTC